MKYVFWIHSSTSYYMAKAIIAKENLDCHNVVYLIDRNYANKYHNNIDIEIEDISFWMNKFYPMKIKTILNLRRIIYSPINYSYISITHHTSFMCRISFYGGGPCLL